MMRLVLDTNVLVSGMINAFGPPGQIIDLIREGLVELVVDDQILAEYAEVLSRPKFRPYFSAKEVRDILAFLERNSHYLVSTAQAPDLPDPDDRPFFELALSAGVPLVTGNVADFTSRRSPPVTVFTPARFLSKRGRLEKKTF